MLFLSLTVYFFPSLSGFSYRVLFTGPLLEERKKQKKKKKKKEEKKKSMGNLG